jgi:hypothetical protein
LGPAVVEPLLAAVIGQGPPGVSVADMLSFAGAVGALLEAVTARPPSAPLVENALSVLAFLDEHDRILGAIGVLEGGGDDRLKQAASDVLVDAGEPALAELRARRPDGPAASWVADAVVEIESRLHDSAGDDR